METAVGEKCPEAGGRVASLEGLLCSGTTREKERKKKEKVRRKQRKSVALTTILLARHLWDVHSCLAGEGIH
jgi:hypothetical protein